MDPSDLTAPARLDRLETHIAHLERQYDELNQVVVEQGRELGRLRQLMQRVSTSVETIELDRIKGTNPRPPHAVI